MKYLLLLAFALTANAAHAQLCNGSLGDPVVKLDFGSGSATHGSALGSSITSYTWTTADFPSDGYYTVESTTNTPNVWWTTTDHTGGGYMMVVNASFSITDYFYKNTVTGLCPETTYEFAAWIMNLLRYTDNSLPNITFTIEQLDGTVLNSYSTGDIAKQSSPVWKQYGFYFTTPANVSSVVIRMRNNKVGAAPGNDIALDDITFRPCGPTVTSALSTGDTSMEMCEGATTYPVLTSNLSTGYSTPSYQWQVSTDNGTTWTDVTGATSATYTIQTALTVGSYLYRLTVANGNNISSPSCRVASNLISIIVNEQPVASSNKPTCQGTTLELYSTGSANYTYSWTGPNGFTSLAQNPVIPNITAANNGVYYLTVSGYCSSFDSVTVDAHELPQLSAGEDVSICQGDSIMLNASSSETSFHWLSSSTLSDTTTLTPYVQPRFTTSYILTASNSLCTAYDTVTVFVLQSPQVDAGPDKYIIKGTSVTIEATAIGGDLTYEWTPAYNISATNVLQPQVDPEEETTYVIVATSSHGCGLATDSVLVKVYENLSIPNVFSPNGDGINDTWHILQLNNYSDATVTVFNRYGQVVYNSTGYPTEWDGRYNGQTLPVGTYYYIIDLKLNVPLKYTGWVEILK